LGTKNVTPESIADYQAAEYNKLFKELAASVASSIFGSPKGGASTAVKKEATKTGEVPASPGKPIMLTKAPQDSQLDWNKPNAEVLYIENKGYLKSSGKFVTWR
jgi:hypothetical protein